jgi:hypothetical protein
MAIWIDICTKYGFVNPGSNFLEIGGHPRDHLVTYKYKVPTALSKVAIPSLSKRFFRIAIDDSETWETGEILSVESWDKDRIWAQLTELRPGLSHHSQFLFHHSTGEIPRLSTKLPLGMITVVRIKFRVTWRIEMCTEDIVQQDMHAGFTVQTAWERLHTQAPRLFQNATFNYAGLLQPGLIIQADVMREQVTVSINFEVQDRGWIEYPRNTISNMLTKQEIYDHFRQDDARIPPLAEYIEEEQRPYHTGVPVNFFLKAHIPITDNSDEPPGRLGGDNGRGIDLPAIKFGKPPINTADPKDPKVAGSLKGQPGDGDDSESEDSCPTDSFEDQTGEEHRLRRIALALHKKEPVMVIFVGHFQGYQDIDAQVEFRLSYEGPPPPSLKQFFNLNWARIRDAAPRHGSTSVPGSLLWTIQKIEDDSLNIGVYKFGMGLKVRYEPKSLTGLPLEKCPAVFTVDLADGLSIAFPGVPRLPDAILMQFMVNLSAPWDGHEYGKPWTVYLTQQPWRKSETGEIQLQGTLSYPPEINAEAYNPRVPFNSAQPRDFSEITDDKDVSRILKFGRDNGWNMLLSMVSSLDGTNSLTLTYESSLTDCEDDINWFWQRFGELMYNDGLIGLPIFARPGIQLKRSCKIEDHVIHIFLTEERVATPEEDGPPCILLYGPRATFKLRCESIVVALRAVTMFYNREPTLSEEHHGKDWALIASIDGGEIADRHRIQSIGKHGLEKVATWNKETFIAGLATQPYGAGLGKFTAKFNPEEPYSATMAIEKGVHEE